MREAQTSTDGLQHILEREVQLALTLQALVAQFIKPRLLDIRLILSKESQYTPRGDSEVFSTGQLL